MTKMQANGSKCGYFIYLFICRGSGVEKLKKKINLLIYKVLTLDSILHFPGSTFWTKKDGRITVGLQNNATIWNTLH